MNQIAGITYIQLGGQERPLKFGTNQSGVFCSLRNMEMHQYWEMLQDAQKMSDITVFRDILYSGLYAGARSEKLPTDFNNEDVGDWFDDVEDKEGFIKTFSEALQGKASPNGNRAQKRAAEKKS